MSDEFFRQIVRDYHPYFKANLRPQGRPIHYAAVWGNAYEESGGFRNMIEKPGQHAGGVNGWQWTGYIPPNDRRARFELFCRENNYSPNDLTAGIHYFVVETNGPENRAWVQTCKTTELLAATETFMLKWERPAIQGGRENNYGTARLDIRYKGAQIALSEIEKLEGKTEMSDTPVTTEHLPPANPMAGPPVQHPDILSALNAISAHLHMINSHLPNLTGVLQELPAIANNPMIGIASSFVPGLRGIIPFIQMAANAAPAIERAVPQVLSALQAIAQAFDEAKKAVK